jgi:basic membrane protein A
MKQAQRKLWIGFTLLAAIGLVMSACGPAPTPVVVRETVEVPVEVEVQVTQEVEVETVVTATAAPIEVPQVALIMSGKREDQTWNQFMADSVQRLADEGKIEASFAEDVTPADFERVAGDYASQGYDLIIAHTSDYTEAALKVAAEYPEVYFAVTGATQFLPNMAGLNNWTHDASAVAGYLAAHLTESNTVGIIGAFAFPTQFVAHEGFKYGVFRANQERLNADRTATQVHCLETFTNTWFDNALGFEAAKAQMDQGADVLYLTLSGGGIGVIQAAEETGTARVIGAFTDMNAFAPDVVVTSVERLADVPLQAILFDIQNGRFEGKDYGFNLTNGGTALSPYHNFDSEIPQDVKDKVQAFQGRIIAGQVRVPFVTAKLGGETGCEAPIPPEPTATP